ncbi:MAG: T9SS type A sorting domain-containing protein [Melioribacteraceae bacterium]|nr:T9SS type A sorting domain-containing protein [Melioribacteraceae bacterium]
MKKLLNLLSTFWGEDQFWNYYSYNQLGYRRCYGIVDTAINHIYPTTDLYTEIKNNISPRLTGKLGDELLNLNYSGNFNHRTDDIDGVSYVSTTNISWLNDSYSVDSIDYHIGEFVIPNNDLPKYFFVVNLMTSDSINLSYSISGLSQSYTNYSVKNIEGGLDTSFTGNSTVYDRLGISDGHLYRVGPVIIYGGDVVDDETISNSATLEDTLFVLTDKTLSIDDDYTITKNIMVEDDGIIEIGEDGNIIRSGSANLYFSSWDQSLILADSDRNPRIVWGKHPNFSVDQYKIYRAISMTQVPKPLTLDYDLIDTVSDDEYEFVDYDIRVGNWDYIYYYVRAYNQSTQQYSVLSNIIETRGGLYKESNKEEQKITEFRIYQNTPNPFNPTTTIYWQLPKAEHVIIEVFDILGARVAEVVNQNFETGYYTTNFDGSRLPSGVYIYTIRAGSFNDSKKMLLLK